MQDLPMIAKTGGCKTADTYHNLFGAGLNWHLFNTIDILKYSTGDTTSSFSATIVKLKHSSNG